MTSTPAARAVLHGTALHTVAALVLHPHGAQHLQEAVNAIKARTQLLDTAHRRQIMAETVECLWGTM